MGAWLGFVLMVGVNGAFVLQAWLLSAEFRGLFRVRWRRRTS